MTRSQRLVLVVSILASFVAFLDGSVVNVALPVIDRELGGGLVIQQWVVDAYLLTLCWLPPGRSRAWPVHCWCRAPSP